jgi:PIN domain nuclease of toxin-antitoxin system
LKLLLDTHALLWALLDDERLTASARRAIERADAVFVSAASIWEIALKQRLGKLPHLHIGAGEIPQLVIDSRFSELPVTLVHAARVAELPQHHRDPFDHLLIAQALAERLTLLTADPLLARYPVKTHW